MIRFSTPDAPDEWLDAVRSRSSRRSFDSAPIEPAVLGKLEGFAHAHHPTRIARVLVVREVPDRVFTGIVGSYGRVTGSPSALVFVGCAGAPGVDEAVGYTGEAVVLEAARLGLDTCWIAGTFKMARALELVRLEAGERVFAVSPLGRATERLSLPERTVYGHKTTGPKPRKPAEEIAPGLEGWPPWARAGVEAARLAPSAMNRQPWRFAYTGGRVQVAYDGLDSYRRVSKRLDCGIAMLHFEIAARHAGAAGHWELAPDGTFVAEYVLA